MTQELFRRSATELSDLLARGEVSSVEVTRSHLDRIAAVDGRVRAFADVFRDRALSEAAERDAERRRGDVRGPLHGLPMSFKECFELGGLPTTLGLRKRMDRRAPRDAALVRVAKEAGAVLLGRSNLPQTMISMECRNPIFGETNNPWRLSHAPGGSSGGEAAALAAGLSPLGIGSDIGGSIRIPAHCCGIVGFKPTLDRWTNLGLVGVLPGQEAARSQAGPLARTVGDLWLLLRALDTRRMSNLDPRVPPMAWSDPFALPLSGLRIGYYEDDGLIAASPALARAVHRAVDVLRAAGAEVVPFRPPNLAEGVFSYYSGVAADGGETFAEALRGEEADPSVATLLRLCKVPTQARPILARALALRGEKRLSRMVSSMLRRTVAEYWKLTAELRNYRQEMFEALDAARIDVLLAPPLATPALPQGHSADFTLAASYTMIYNLVQFPAGVVPVTRVRADDPERPAPKDKFDHRALEIDRQSVGLPVGVQVIARPFHDETVIAVMAAIERGVAGDQGFPRTPIEPTL